MKGRYVTEGPTERTGAAIMPVPARLGMGYQSWGPVSGSPGTARIPAPAPFPGTDASAVATAIQGAGPGGMGRPSQETPYWTPGVYYQPRPPAGPDSLGVATESDTQMPIPARLPNGSYGFGATGNESAYFAARRSQLLRQRQVGWPFVAPKYSWRA